MKNGRRQMLQVILPENLAEELGREAAASDLTKAQLTRAALRAYLRERGQARKGQLPGQLEIRQAI